MVEAFEDFDFAVEVVLELLIKLREVHRLDSYKSSRSLKTYMLALRIVQIPLISKPAIGSGFE